MIFARRLIDRDDRGDWTEDFQGVHVPRAAKRAKPFDEATVSQKRRDTKLRAIAILRRNGFTAAEAAIAVDLSERHVKRRSSLIRYTAEAQGRV